MGRPKTGITKRLFFAISINADLKQEYSEFCKKNGYAISKRIKLFIEKDMNNKVKFDE